MGWRDAPVEETVGWEQAPEDPPSVAEDIGYSIPSAIGRIPFAIAGAPAAFTGLGMEAGRGLDYAWQKYIQGRENPDVETAEQVAARNPLAHLTPQALEETFWEKPTGTQFYDPQTDPGKITAATITGAGAGALTGGGAGAGPATLISGTATGAGAGAGAEYARQLAEGSPWEIPATIAGGVVGGRGGQAVAGGVRRAVTPHQVSRSQAQFARTLRDTEGIRHLTEGQITWNDRLKAAERKRIPVTHQATQYEDLTQAALRRVGINARQALPEVMNPLFEEMSTGYRTLGGRNTLVGDQGLGVDLAAARANYNRLVGEPNRTPAVQNYMEEIRDHLTQGQGNINGATYSSLRSRILDDVRSVTDPRDRTALQRISLALDDAMERSIAANNPRDLGAFRTLNTRYRNALVIEDAVSNSGEWSPRGLITPDALSASTRALHGERNWVRGQGPYAELSRAAAATMRPLPPTGVAPFITPLSTMNLPSMLLAAIPRGVNALRMTEPVQRLLTNRMMPQPAGTPTQRTLTGAIPSIATQVQPSYRAVVDALNQGGGSSQIRPEILNDPRVRSIIDALAGAGQADVTRALMPPQ